MGENLAQFVTALLLSTAFVFMVLVTIYGWGDWYQLLQDATLTGVAIGIVFLMGRSITSG